MSGRFVIGTTMHVMAGVLLDGAGRVLLAQRPEGKHLAGMWEFPGGKCEPGESARDALRRELYEELAIAIEPERPLIRVPWDYAGRRLLLDAWLVRRWQGELIAMEGQALQWRWPMQVDPAQLAPADRPILQALRLPPRWLVTSAAGPAQCEARAAQIVGALESGERLVQLHLPDWPRWQSRELARALLPTVRRHGATLLLEGDVEGARELGAGVGVLLEIAQGSVPDARPLPWQQAVAARCGDAAQVQQAARAEVDFAVLCGHHPWPQFEAIADTAPLPLYAGGPSLDEAMRARRAAGQGVAGTPGGWR